MILDKIPNKGEIKPVETISIKWALFPVEEWGHPPISKNLSQNCSYLKEMQRQKWCSDWRKGHPEITTPRDPSHLQTPSPDTITDVKKCLLTEAWYSCPLRGSAST
jgi:hypothetical protein